MHKLSIFCGVLAHIILIFLSHDQGEIPLSFCHAQQLALAWRPAACARGSALRLQQAREQACPKVVCGLGSLPLPPPALAKPACLACWLRAGFPT